MEITNLSLQNLMESSQRLHGALLASPLWELVRHDQIIVQWINALSQVESEMKRSSENESKG